MDKKWDLSQLYNSFDKHFEDDVQSIQNILEDMKKYPTYPIEEKYLEEYLYQENDLGDLVEKVYSFINLTMNGDTSNQLAIKYNSMLENLLASFADMASRIEKWIGQFEIDKCQNAYIQKHAFILKEMQAHNQYLLDEQSESVLANMKATGSSSWLTYKDQLISSLKVSIDNQEYPLTEVLNMAYSKDKEIRKKAYESELKSYKQVELGVCSALNAIKGESITIANIRGYDSVLQRTLIDSRMSQKTLDVLLLTIEKSLPMFEKYYQTKAKALGYKNGLPWYDLYAPIVDVQSHYNYEEGCQFVVEQFTKFSKELGDYANMAISQNWIDVYPRDGKVGGAFCSNLHCLKQSRFLLNYGDDFSDTITLAHELGHGYHGHCLNDQTALNSSYPMPIAETASTFCETIVKKSALQDAAYQQKIMILDNELSDCAQVIVDIYSRFLFENSFIEKRKEGPLSIEETKELMLNAQKKAYGKGLDHNNLHPYMWTWKPHYYESDYAFYNFPYAFGLLLAKGLYGMYKKEGETFVNTYQKFLSLTGQMDLLDAAKTVGIDLEDETFWQKSLDMIEEDLKEFYILLDKLS
ncbi:MAG: M3 family oligoendopeptidase [Coprobacillus sp.]